MAMEVDVRGRSEGANFTVESPGIDLASFIQPYKGPMRVERLEFIGDHAPSLRAEAYWMALAELKQSTNYMRYESIGAKLTASVGSSADVDAGWVQRTRQAVEERTAALENDLKAYKDRMIKEQIRLGHMDLGEHLASAGHLTAGMHYYRRGVDYCSTTAHLQQILMAIGKLALEARQLDQVKDAMDRIEGLPGMRSDAPTMARIAVFRALRAFMGPADRRPEFRETADRLIELNFSAADGLSDLVSVHDLGRLACLTGLASYSRRDLLSAFERNVEFRQYLESAPGMRELLEAFTGARYKEALTILDRTLPILRLDVMLSPSVPYLYAVIRSRALVQYIQPYSSVSMAALANEFNSTPEVVENDIAALILSGDVQGRIDGRLKTLNIDAQERTYVPTSRVLELGKAHERLVSYALLRVQLASTMLVDSRQAEA